MPPAAPSNLQLGLVSTCHVLPVWGPVSMGTNIDRHSALKQPLCIRMQHACHGLEHMPTEQAPVLTGKVPLCSRKKCADKGMQG